MHGTLDILVTGGRMISRLDAVRSVTNESTGATAAALVEEFLASGARVTYFHFRDAERPYRRQLQVEPEQPFDEQLRSLRKTHETYRAMKPQLTECSYETFDEYQRGLRAFATQRRYAAIILAAAVADYSFSQAAGKISSDQEYLVLAGRKNEKVISHVKEWDPDSLLVGFKLLGNVSREELLRVAEEKRNATAANLTVANRLLGESFHDREYFLLAPELSPVPLLNSNALAPTLVQAVYNQLPVQ